MNVEDLIGSFRRHWRIAAAIFFLSLLVAGMFVITRDTPDQKRAYEASSRYRVPGPNPTNSKPAPTDVPEILTNNILTLATAEATLDKARSVSALAQPEEVTYKATLSEEGDVVTLITVARSAKRADRALLGYNSAFTDSREKALVADSTRKQRGFKDRLDQLNAEQRTIETQLRRQLDPLPPLVLVDQNGNKQTNNNSGSTPAVLELPDDVSTQTRLLANERNALYSEQVRIESAYGALTVQLTSPDAYATLIAINRAGRIVPPADSPLVPVGMILIGGLILGLAAALLADYFDSTIHTAKAAGSALGAPVLAKIPARHRFEERFADPVKGSERSAAYRGLAATSIATDRLPKALLVTSPASDTQDGVAFNYANGLTALGMKVALLATQPSQSWYLDPLEHTGGTPTLLPELLTAAQAGTLGDVTDRLATSERNPGLAIAPPGTEYVHLPLDGLTPLLTALDEAGFDIVIVAGPQMLDDADATIFAYAIRNVLWTVETHAARERDARAAAEHLDLTGGAPFGVALIGEEI